MVALFGALPGNQEQISSAQDISSLPLRMDLRSARRLAPAAYWASWADALPDRLPAGTEAILEGEPEGRLGELGTAARLLDRDGFIGRPTWDELRAGATSNMVGSTTHLPLPNTTSGRA